MTLLQAGEGQPIDDQLKEMMRKLLADRLRLAFHHEKRDLALFTIVTLKAGTKLVDSLNVDGPAGVGTGLGADDGEKRNDVGLRWLPAKILRHGSAGY